MHNLCVVYVERGKLRQALECLQRAHKLAPEESYILKHLNIVKQRIVDLSQAAAMQKQKTMPNDGNGFEEIDNNEGSDYDENNTTTTDNTKSNEMLVEHSSHPVDNKRSTQQNQKNHPDDSTTSGATNSINPNGIRWHDDPPHNNKIDAVDAETESKGHTGGMGMGQPAPNRRTETHKINHERTPTTRFGHDSDEPSSGTS